MAVRRSPISPVAEPSPLAGLAARRRGGGHPERQGGQRSGLIVWGSCTLTPLLLHHGLADEVLLLVFLLLVGRGKRFFSEASNPRELTLVKTEAAASGVLMNTYHPPGR